MKSYFSTLILALWGTCAGAMTLDEYLSMVQKSHHGALSFKESQRAASLRRESNDVGLSPVLTLKASQIDDKNPQVLGPFTTNQTKMTEYSLGLAKTFSSGTLGSVSMTTAEINAQGLNGLVSPAAVTNSTYGKSSIALALSQSLWKNSFGKSTHLRWQREAAIEGAEKQSYNLQLRQLMIESEAAFWDLLYMKEELRQRQDSLDRAKRIETWIKRRVGNGIGDDADLYNAQGLVAARELQLLMTQDELKASEIKVRDFLELSEGEKSPEFSGDLNGQRALSQMASGTEGKKVRLDSYLAVLEAKTKAVAAQEVEDAYRPDLTLEGLYKTNSSEPTLSESLNKVGETDKTTTSLALKLTWLLDGDVKTAARSLARSESLAATLKQERKLLESDSSWAEMNRRHNELSKKVNAAQIASDLQAKKAAAEREKLSKGRSVTSQVITAEQDAAEALLTLTKLRAEQRKLESQGRLFVTIEEQP